MRLYVLKERWGRRVRSPRKPWSVPVVDYEVPIKAGMYDWVPWVLLGPLAWEVKVGIFNWYMHIAIDCLGLTGPAVKTFVIAKFTVYAECALVFKLVALAIPAVIAAAAVYIENPEFSDFVWEEVFPWRYIMRYENRIWGADLLGITDLGRPYYVICKEIGPVITMERRGVYLQGAKCDQWYSHDLWVDVKDEFLQYWRWFWSNIFVEYIGFLLNYGTGYYNLQEGYDDPYVAELPAGYVHPPELRCKGW